MGNALEDFADFCLSYPQFMVLLEVKPDFRARTKPLTKAQSRIRTDATLAVQYLGYAIDRHTDSAGEVRRTNADFVKLV